MKLTQTEAKRMIHDLHRSINGTCTCGAPMGYAPHLETLIDFPKHQEHFGTYTIRCEKQCGFYLSLNYEIKKQGHEPLKEKPYAPEHPINVTSYHS